MTDIQSNIHVNVDTSGAISAIKNLQREISVVQQELNRGSATQAAQASKQQQNLINNLNATRNFSAGIQNIKTTTESFTTSLEKNKLSLGEYFKYSAASTKTFGSMFKTEMGVIDKVARERVKSLQTQYVKLGRDANGAMKAIAIRPLTLDMESLATKTAIAAQKQQLFNQLMKQGSTNLLNFGKNTQWAGRQLMVGFTVPLLMLGSTATKTFMQMETQVIRFRRVYGDLNTTVADTNKMVVQLQQLAGNFTQYGVAVADTMKMAADAAAMGKTGADLLAQVNNAARLSVLGGVDQQQALETTTSLTNAFGISADNLSSKINFLNAVENQTVLSIEDMTVAIPKAAPVIKQLGGNVEDLTFFLTAMKEGGINASEGANAIKSGMASLINPTKSATDMLAGFGVNIKGIVQGDKGNIKKTVIDVANALDKLDPLNRAQAIEKLFGKFQFSRISTLLQNVVKGDSQASKVLELSSATKEELQILADRELKKVSDSPMFKFKKAVEDLKVSLVPLGEEFLKAVTPIAKIVTDVLKGFNGMGEGTKSFITGLGLVIAGLAPIALMAFGLIANGIANFMKLFMGVKNFFSNLGRSTTTLGEQTQYMTQEQLDASAAAASLEQSHTRLTQVFSSEATAILELRNALQAAALAQMEFRGMSGGVASPMAKFAEGGIIRGPGTGTSDSIIARVSNGEAIIPAASVAKNPGLVNSLVTGNLPGFAEGKGYGNATLYMPESWNTRMNSQGSGVPMGEVTQYFKKAGDAAMAPLMAVMAKEMGMKVSDPAFQSEWKRVGTKLSQSVIGALESSGQKIATDATFEEVVVPALRRDAQALDVAGRNLSTSMNNAIDQIRTVAPIGVKSGASTQAGAVRGRSSWIGAYRSGAVSKDAQTYATRENPEMFRQTTRFSTSRNRDLKQFQTLNTATKQWEVGTMAHITQAMNASYQELLARMTPYLGDVSGKLMKALGMKAADGLATGAKEQLQVNSPSRVMQAIGKFAGQGLVKGAKEEIPAITQAGEALGMAARTGLISAPGMGAANPFGVKDYVPPVAHGTDPFGPSNAHAFDNIHQESALLTTGTGGRFSPSDTSRVDARVSAFGQKVDSAITNLTSKSKLAEKAFSVAGGIWGRAMARGEAQAVQEGELYAKRVELAQQELMLNDAEMQENQARVNLLIDKKASTGALTALEENELIVRKETMSAKLSAVVQQIAIDEEEMGELTLRERMLGKKRGVVAKEGAAAGMGAGMGGKLMGIGMALSTATMMASMMPGEIGKAAQNATPYVMGLSMALPLMTSPMGALVIGIAGVVAAILLLRAAFDGAQDDAIKAAQATKSSNEALEKYAKFTGKVTASDIMDRRRENAKTPFGIQVGKSSFGQSFVATDQGKELSKKVATATAGGYAGQMTSDLSQQLMTAVTSGAMTLDQAKSAAANIAFKGGNVSMGMKIIAKMEQILGPDGENITKNPLKVRMQMLATSDKQWKNSFAKANGQDSFTKMEGTTAGQVGSVAAGAGAGALAGAGIGAWLGTLGGPFAPLTMLAGAGIGAGIGAAVGAIGAYFQIQDTVKKSAKMSAAAAVDAKIALEQNKQNLDSLDLYYTKKIEELRVAGKINEAHALEKKYLTERNTLTAAAAKEQKNMVDSFNGAGDLQTSMLQGAQKALAAKYKDNPDQLAYVDAAKQQLSNLEGSGKLSAGQEYLFTLKMASGDIPPSQMRQLLDLADSKDKKQADAVISIMAKWSGGTSSTLADILGGVMDGSNKGAIQTEISVLINAQKTESDAMDILTNLNVLNQVGGVTQSSFDIDYYAKPGNKESYDNLNKVNDLIAEKKPKTVTILTSIIPSLKNANMNKEQTDFFNTLSGSDQQTYSLTVSSILNVDQKTEVNDPAFIAWLSDTGKFGGSAWDYRKNKSVSIPTALGQYAIAMGTKAVKDGKSISVAPPGSQTPPAGGSGGPTKSFLDDIVKTMRDVTKANQDLTVGFNASLKALLNFAGKGASAVTGLSNAMRIAKVSSGFMKDILGLDQKEKKQAMDKFFTKDKNGKLVMNASGQAVNSRYLANTIFGFQDTKIQEVTDANNQAAALKKLTANGMSYADASEVVKDKAVAEAIAMEKKNKVIKDTIALYLKAKKAAEAALSPEDQIKALQDKANAYFSAQENQIELKFKVDNKTTTDTITKAQSEIASKQYSQNIYDAGLKSITDKETAINKTYDNRVKALDKIQKINESISKQKQSQLTLADALSRGDISAAAQAAQDQNAQNAADATTNQRDALSQAHDKELASLTAMINGKALTREQIEASIKTIQDEIYTIEMNRLKPAEEALRLATEKKTKDLEIFESQKTQWETLQNKIDLAKTGAYDYVQLLKDAQTISAKIPGVTPAPVIKPVYNSQGFTTSGDASAFGSFMNTVGYNGAQGTPIARSMGGIVPSYYAAGGYAKGTDTVPAMLTPGEFVVKKYAVDNFGVDKLNAINNGQSLGESSTSVLNAVNSSNNATVSSSSAYTDASVYNYSVSVNVKSDANPDQIAQAVMMKINQTNGQRIRGNRFNG